MAKRGGVASDNDYTTEGIVFLMGGDGAIMTYILRHISVSIVSGGKRFVVLHDFQHATDNAGTLVGSTELAAPDVIGGGYGVGGYVFLRYVVVIPKILDRL